MTDSALAEQQQRKDIEKIVTEVALMKKQYRISLIQQCATFITVMVGVLSAFLVFKASIHQTDTQMLQSMEAGRQHQDEALKVEDKRNDGMVMAEVLKSNDQVEVARRLKFLSQVSLLHLTKEQLAEVDKSIPVGDRGKTIVIPGAPSISALFDKIDSYLKEYRDIDIRDVENPGMSKIERLRLNEARQRLVEIRTIADYLHRKDVYRNFYDGLHTGVHMVDEFAIAQ